MNSVEGADAFDNNASLQVTPIESESIKRTQGLNMQSLENFAWFPSYQLPRLVL